jgi:predicted nuclease of predicted toxin-antitoxin system
VNILVDENIPTPTVTALRELGHFVIDVRESQDKGISDDRVWELAQQQRALVVTTDKGFVRHGPPHSGVLVVRLRQPNQERIHQRILKALAFFEESSWPGQIVVMRDRARSVRRSRPAD